MSRYDPGSNFESCPAATGPARCTHFPDGSHRCAAPRDHYTTDGRRADERTHRCTCGAEWTALMGSIGNLFKTVLKPSEQLAAKLISEYVEGAQNRHYGVPLEPRVLFGNDAHGGAPDGIGSMPFEGCDWPAEQCSGHYSIRALPTQHKSDGREVGECTWTG